MTSLRSGASLVVSLLLLATVALAGVSIAVDVSDAIGSPPPGVAVDASGYVSIEKLRTATDGQGQSPSASMSANNSLSPGEVAAGWILLFDGRTLSGWSPSGNADWKVEDGTITFTQGQGLLISSRSFSNFELKAEFWPEKTANSGIYLRCPDVATGRPNSKVCYEVNIFDPHETAPTGSIVNVHSVLPDRPDTAEKWNTYEITADGTHLVVKLNGKAMTDVREDKFKFVSGTIALQAAGPDGPGRIKFRNIKIRPL